MQAMLRVSRSRERCEQKGGDGVEDILKVEQNVMSVRRLRTYRTEDFVSVHGGWTA